MNNTEQKKYNSAPVHSVPVHIILGHDLMSIVFDYLGQVKLLDWIDERWIRYIQLPKNPSDGAMLLLQKYINQNPRMLPTIIPKLCTNENNIAIDIIDKYLEGYSNGILLSSSYVDWIDMSMNKNIKCIHLITQYFTGNIVNDIPTIASNPNAIDIIYKYTNKGHGKTSGRWWRCLSRNPNDKVVDIIEDDIKNGGTHVNWAMLSKNTNDRVFKILMDNINNSRDNPYTLLADISQLSSNTHPNITDILKLYHIPHSHELDWYAISANPSAIALLETEYKRGGLFLDWDIISSNPNAIPLIEDAITQGGDVVNWNVLSTNPNAIPLIKMDIEFGGDNVNWYCLCDNTNEQIIPLIKHEMDTVANYGMYIDYADTQYDSPRCDDEYKHECHNKYPNIVNIRPYHWYLLSTNAGIFRKLTISDIL